MSSLSDEISRRIEFELYDRELPDDSFLKSDSNLHYDDFVMFVLDALLSMSQDLVKVEKQVQELTITIKGINNV